MASTVDFVAFVCEQIRGPWDIRYKKMFGEYMVYVNEKPVLLVCENMVFVKKLAPLEGLLQGAPLGAPYQGAKEHYVLEIDNAALSREVVALLEAITPLPKPRKKKQTAEKT